MSATKNGLKFVRVTNKAGYMTTQVVCGWAWAVIKSDNLSNWSGAIVQKSVMIS